MELGLQLWSVRDQLALNIDDTLLRIAKLGIKNVEALDIGHAQSLTPQLKQYDLSLTSTFIYWAHITKRWDLYDSKHYPWHAQDTKYETLAETCKALGLETAVLGYIPPTERKNVDAFKIITDNLNTACEAFTKVGVKLAYHNHAFEFEQHAGFIFYDYLINNTDSLLFELDTFWSHVTGNSPVDLLDKLGKRCCSIHLKNVKAGFPKTYDDQIMPKDYFVPLGEGEINMEKIIEKTKLWGVKNLFLEQDYAKNIWGELEQSIKYLTTV